MPSGGPVQSYSITQGPGGQSQPYVQTMPQPPGNGWTPKEIVTGFLTASASFSYRQIAREYLAPDATWNPTWSAVVYSKGPTVNEPVYPAKGQNTAYVTVSGSEQASLSQYGAYAVPSAKSPQQQEQPPSFTLRKVSGGQWRITQAPSNLLLSSHMFNYDYQQRNLYFFDPKQQFLVPDPVYVPLQATPAELMNNLVRDLISPPLDWLHGGTHTAFPGGTAIRAGDVTLEGGTATVNLRGAIDKANDSVMAEVSAQLFWTLSGSGQGGASVQSVEVLQNGHPWNPPNSQQNPVQHQFQFKPPQNVTSGMFYYLDKTTGNLMEENGIQGSRPAKVNLVGKGFTQIAVSPNGGLVAALNGGTLFTGPIRGKLVKRGTGYATVSWGLNGDLWTTTTSGQIVMLNVDQPSAAPVTVPVVNSNGLTDQGSFSGLRIAPDGVRVAIIDGGSVLSFGAIAGDSQAGYLIHLSPFYVAAPGTVMFDDVTWYGPDNVITLGEPGLGSGPVLTEYPVNGGTSTSVPAPSGTVSITAAAGQPLIAGLAKGYMEAGATLGGNFAQIQYGTSDTPVKGLSPVYPG